MKKILLGFGCFMILFFSSEKVTHAATQCGKSVSGSEYKVCDIDKNNVINGDDAVMILKNSNSAITFNAEQKILADANGDGAINTGDAVEILRYAAGIANNYTGKVCKQIKIGDYRLGDVNKDGSITDADAIAVLGYTIKSVQFDSVQKQLAEANGDGTVNTGDAVEILRYIENDADYLLAECKDSRQEAVTNPKTSDISIILISLIALGALFVVLYQYNKKTKLN